MLVIIPTSAYTENEEWGYGPYPFQISLRYKYKHYAQNRND
jgi:hypothetical protein